MKFNIKTVCTVIVVGGLAFGAMAQINLLSNSINFRTSSNAAQTTEHYGDLYLQGGSSGTSWGWLTANRINCMGDAYINGDFYALGTTKSFVQPHPTDTTKVIKYICIEAGEAMVMVRGLSKTNSGSVVVDLPEHFGLVTSADAPLTVLITPENAPVLLYTTAKSKEQITVVMKPADFKTYGDAEFAWQVSGVRDGFEDERIICDMDSLLNGTLDNKPVSGKSAKMKVWREKIVEKQKDKAGKKK